MFGVTGCADRRSDVEHHSAVTSPSSKKADRIYKYGEYWGAEKPGEEKRECPPNTRCRDSICVQTCDLEHPECDSGQVCRLAEWGLGCGDDMAWRAFSCISLDESIAEASTGSGHITVHIGDKWVSAHDLPQVKARIRTVISDSQLHCDNCGPDELCIKSGSKVNCAVPCLWSADCPVGQYCDCESSVVGLKGTKRKYACRPDSNGARQRQQAEWKKILPESCDSCPACGSCL